MNDREESIRRVVKPPPTDAGVVQSAGKATKATMPGRIYFVGAADFTGPIKIGFTRDVGRRLIAIQCGNPVHLAVWASVPGTLEEELSLHAAFSDSRSRDGGEWYNQTQRLLWLVTLCGCEAFPYPDVTAPDVFAAMIAFGHLPARRFPALPRARTRRADLRSVGGT